VFYICFAKEMVKIHRLVLIVSAGNLTLCRRHNISRQLPVDQASCRMLFSKRGITFSVFDGRR
jgi:hypothetical protein